MTLTDADRRARRAAYMRDWTRRRREADPEGFRAYRTAVNRRYRQRHPEKRAAVRAVEYAIRKGRLVRPDRCDRCQAAGPVEASHNDYTRRLEVEWLCRRCHAAKDAPYARKGD